MAAGNLGTIFAGTWMPDEGQGGMTVISREHAGPSLSRAIISPSPILANHVKLGSTYSISTAFDALERLQVEFCDHGKSSSSYACFRNIIINVHWDCKWGKTWQYWAIFWSQTWDYIASGFPASGLCRIFIWQWHFGCSIIDIWNSMLYTSDFLGFPR